MDLEIIDSQLTEWLREKKLTIQRSEQGNISIFYTGKIGYRIMFCSFHKDGFNIIGTTGRHVPEESINQACRYACEINYRRSISTVEVDPSDGEWRVRLYVSLMEHESLPTSVVDEHIGFIRRELDKLHEAFETGIFVHPDTEEESEEVDPFQDDELRKILEGED